MKSYVSRDGRFWVGRALVGHIAREGAAWRWELVEGLDALVLAAGHPASGRERLRRDAVERAHYCAMRGWAWDRLHWNADDLLRMLEEGRSR